MVTFALGGKDYGIDIMNVKEIHKAEQFTLVPNTAPFVRGVFNLRGDIISVIDLRIMFNLPASEQARDEMEDVIFLKVDDHLIGIIVDRINDVVGIDSSTIQPPHPLFGDINLKYISGVVEYQDNLFVILDSESIFGTDDSLHTGAELPRRSAPLPEIPVSPTAEPPRESETLGYTFITETLSTFRSFEVSDVNEDWIRGRFDEWIKLKGNEPAALQLKSPEDADEFLRPFYSANTGMFWPDETADAFGRIALPGEGILVSAWEIGCGQGYEAYSLAAALKGKYPDKQIKVWAHDKDLIKVSNAPNMVFQESELPAWIRKYANEGSKGWVFSKEIADSILFEYHDVTHDNPLPPVNLVFARDILSFLSGEARGKLLGDFREKLTPGGALIIGDHERLIGEDWSERESDGFRWYVKTL